MEATRRQSLSADSGGREINVGQSERTLSLLGGGVAVAAGLYRGGWSGALITGLGAGLIYRGATGYCPANARLGRNTAQGESRGVMFTTSLTVAREPQALYQIWRDFSRLPEFMKYLAEVRPMDGERSHWVAEIPAGGRLEWYSELTADDPGERIGWRSLPGSDVDNEGEVHFRPAPGGRGTEVAVELCYRPPGGRAGALAARFMKGLSENLVREDLRRFKRIAEAGEVPTSRVH